MKKYKQLTLSQRYQIEALLKAGISQILIAIQLSVHRSSISRELKRSIGLRGRCDIYTADNAYRKTRKRHKNKFKMILLSSLIKEVISHKMIVDKWSPELISEKHKQLDIPKISHETIYKWIWVSKHTNTKENRK